MKIWLDQDGTFYPTKHVPPFADPDTTRGAYSLIRLADSEEKRQMLVAAERAALAEYRRFIRDKDRIFILIHGFNNDDKEAGIAYEQIKNIIALKEGKNGDGVVEVYWDGLVGEGVGIPYIWFPATGYSQLVGVRGLRKLLNVTYGKKIVAITHSRGASVFLSALSDPPYSPSFIRATERLMPSVKVYGEPPLRPNGNTISAVLLAPAIGAIDFNTPYYSAPMRPFDSRLIEVHSTVNSKDPALRKVIGISEKFNPTEYGRSEEAARAIKERDSRFDYTVWDPPMKSHAFGDYVDRKHFPKILESIGVAVKQ